MKDALINIQVLYEIAMSIGTSLDMRTMLQKSLSTYLRKFSCAAGAVLMGKIKGDTLTLDVIFSIPRTIKNNAVYQAALNKISRSMPVKEMEEQLKRLPYIGSHADYAFHVMALPGFGLLLLIKHGPPLDSYLIKSLEPLNTKLGTACLSCLRKERIQSIANDLKTENRERRKAEKALAASHEQLENILNSLTSAVYLAEPKGHKIVLANHHMTELYGENLIGRPCYEVVHGASRPCQKCKDEQLLFHQGLPSDVVGWEEFNPKLSRWLMHHSRAVPWKDGSQVRLHILTDITRIKQLEHERMEIAQLQQKQRLESLGTLAGGIAHEFNNLLMGMMGSISLMRFDMKEQHPFHINLNNMENNIREAAALTDKLLGYAQKGRYENYRFQVNIILRHLVVSLSKTNAAINFKMELDDGLYPIKADRHQIELALLNLLTNACDAMPDGGPLVVSSSNTISDGLTGPNDQPRAESYVRIMVHDHGAGMTAETKERLFEPFYTTKSVGRGAGLGMAATYGIVQGHKGYIEVDTLLGHGTKIEVYLPAATQEVKTRPVTAQAKRTVLLVDDEPIIREIGEQMLNHLGHNVILAADGKEALAIYREQHKEIDLVILDVILPEMTCEQIYDELKTIDNNARILISSGFSMENQVQTVMVKGANEFIQKPFSMEGLKKKINKIFQTP